MIDCRTSNQSLMGIGLCICFFIMQIIFTAEAQDKNWDTPGLTFDFEQYCYYTNDLSSSQANQVSVFTNLVGQDDAIQLRIHNGTDLNLTYRYLENNISYFYESTFRNSTTGNRICQPCRYHDQAIEDECDHSNIRYCYNPFVAYCLDGQSPHRLSCVQDPFLYEPSFFGDFFFPLQKPWKDYTVPTHFILTGKYPKPTDNYFQPNPTLESDPKNYGLSKRNLLRYAYHILHVKYSDPYDDSQQSANVLKLRSEFIGDSGSKWATWGQKHCVYYCHRDSVKIRKYVSSNDIEKTNNTFILNSYRIDEDRDLSICKRCLSDTEMVFMWVDNLEYKIEFNMDGDDGCIPWFGSVPILQNSSTRLGSLEMIRGVFSLDNKIKLPQTETEVYEYPGTYNTDVNDDKIIHHTLTTYQSMLCPVNFYNRICAYTIQDSVNNMSGIAKYNTTNYCTPCPSGGWHTNGKNGSWFCIPPNGQIFFYRTMLTKFWSKNNSMYNHSKAWSRRDLIKYEPECGYLTRHCQQCSYVTGAEGLTPAQFNEIFIFEPLLRVDACRAGYYCPDPLHGNEVQCPSDKACSPSGSHSIANCTCCHGQFLNVSSNQCENCYSGALCRSGTFMQGLTQCNTMIGPKLQYGGGVCSNCTNYPVNSHYVGGNQYGLEWIDGINFSISQLRHICPFRCNRGYKISWAQDEGSKSECHRTYTCEPIMGSLEPFNLQSLGRYGYFYDSNLADKYDEISITKSGPQFVCSVSKTFSNSYTSVETGLSMKEANVYSFCSEANPVECGINNSLKLCMVTQNATYYQNFNCSPCSNSSIAKPLNAYYLEETLIGKTQLSSRTKLCSWKCNEGFYRNGSDCKSCSALALEKCPDANYSIQGLGCRGVDGEFNTLNWTSNCVKCSKSVAMVSSDSYLDETSCAILKCPDPPGLSAGYYFSARCGGGTSKNYVQTPCGGPCFFNQYESNACTNISDRVCRNCTFFYPGYYMREGSGCALKADAQWSPCNFNNYCDGHGTQKMCPNGKLSRERSSSVADCYCPLGTVLNSGVGGGNDCIEKSCLDEKETTESPSADGNKISRYYYSMNENSMETVCVPCNEDQIKVPEWMPSHSYASGSRIGIQSCRCPLSKYAVQPLVSGGQQHNVTCNECKMRTSSECTRTGFYGLLNNEVVCETGLESGPTQCFCILPPYTEKAQQGCSFSRCIPEYESVSTTTDRPSSLYVNVTGSNAYIQGVQSWKLGIRFNAITIKQIVATSNYNLFSSESFKTSVQYLLFTSDSGDQKSTIHVQSVNHNNDGNRFLGSLWGSQVVSNPYDILFRKWYVFDANDARNTEKSIVVFTIAKWPRPLFREIFDPSVITQLYLYWTWVGALVYDSRLSSYSLYVTRMSPYSDSGYSYSFDSLSVIYNVANSTGDGSSLIVSMSHAYSYPGLIPWLPSAMLLAQEVRYGAFYIAYNDPTVFHCGIHAVFVSNNLTNSNTKLHLNLSNSTRRRQIQTATVVENNDNVPGVLVYVLYSDFFSAISEGILLIDWRDAGQSVNFDTPSFSQNNVEYILPKKDRLGQKIISFRNLIRLWGRSTSLKNFMILAEVVESTQKNSTVIFTADSVVRTFTEVQGMPAYSEPSHITGFEKSENEVVFLGSGKGSVYYLEDLKRCSSLASVPVYWNGIDACATHQCSRTRSCSQAQNKQMVSGECMCRPGYFQMANGDCILCPAKSYCNGGVRYSCGGVNQVVSGLISDPGSYSYEQCKCSTGYYFDTSLNRCAACTTGYYCPNSWNKIACPGKSKTSSTDYGHIFPTRCSCMPGAEGPACKACPDGSKCFESTSLPVIPDKINIGVMISVRLKQENLPPNMISMIKDVGCTVLFKEVKAHLGNPVSGSGGLAYFANDITLERRFFCDFIVSDSVLRSQHLFALVVQADINDNVVSLISNIAALYNTISNINNATTSVLFQYAEILNIVYANDGRPDQFSLKSIQVQECPATQAPDAERKECVCKPGYFFQTSRCEPCPIGFFKSTAGQERCLACPAGTTTKTTGGITCKNPLGDNNNGTSSTPGNGSSSTGVIVGGVVGGLFLVLLIIFVYYTFSMNKE